MKRPVSGTATRTVIVLGSASKVSTTLVLAAINTGLWVRQHEVKFEKRCQDVCYKRHYRARTRVSYSTKCLSDRPWRHKESSRISIMTCLEVTQCCELRTQIFSIKNIPREAQVSKGGLNINYQWQNGILRKVTWRSRQLSFDAKMLSKCKNTLRLFVGSGCSSY